MTRGLRGLLAFSPAWVPLFIILRWGVDTHFWDEWDPRFVGVFVKAHQGQLAFADLVAQHNEHRMLVPRLIFLILNFFTHWNNFAYLLTTWIIAAGASAGILLLLRRTTDKPSHIWFNWLLCNLLIFSPNQDQTWLWGIGIPNVLPATFFIGALLAFGGDRRAWSKFWIALFLSAAATYSNGNGLLCWPLIAIVLAFERYWRQLIAWTAAFVLILTLYFHHYVKPTFGGVTGDHGAPTQSLGFFLAFLGNAFSTALPASPQTISILCGSAMLLLFLIALGFFLRAWRDGNRQLAWQLLPWLAIGGFALLSDFFAARGRAGFGIRQALETRYVCCSVYCAVALVALVPLIFRQMPVRFASPILAGLLIVLAGLSFPGALSACRAWSDSQRGVKAAVMLSRVLPQNPQLNRIFPSPQVLVEEADALNQMGYLRPPLIAQTDANLIREIDPGRVGNPGGEIRGQINRSADEITLIGWAIRRREGRPADAVFITYENERGNQIICAMADRGLKTQEIANQLHDPDCMYSGWRVKLSAAIFPPTMETVRLRAWALDTNTGNAFPLDGSYTLER